MSSYWKNNLTKNIKTVKDFKEKDINYLINFIFVWS